MKDREYVLGLLILKGAFQKKGKRFEIPISKVNSEKTKGRGYFCEFAEEPLASVHVLTVGPPCDTIRKRLVLNKQRAREWSFRNFKNVRLAF